MPLYKSTVCPHFKYCVFLHVKKDLLDQNDVQEGIKNSRYRQCNVWTEVPISNLQLFSQEKKKI